MTTCVSTLKSLAFVLLLAVFVTLPNFANADTFDSRSDWEASICGVENIDEFDYGQTGFGFLLDVVLPTSWGTFDYSGYGLTNNLGFVFDEDLGIVVDDRAAALIVDPTLGFVDGISLGYGGAITVDIQLADGTVETVTGPGNGDFTRSFLGWSNTTGQDVVGVTVQATDADPNSSEILLLYGVGFSFGECDTTPSCQDLLQDIIDNLQGKLAVANGCDQYWIQGAIDKLESAQNPLLWQTEDRLSDLGCVFFNKNFYATYYLECVGEDALVEDCLISIQGLLGCVVEAELDYAMENPDASTNLVAYAEYFEDYAVEFADAEMYLQAVILHFYAWLFASNA